MTEKEKEYHRNWREKNREYILQYQKKYRETHKEQLKIYRDNNPEKLLSNRVSCLDRQASENNMDLKSFNLALNAWSKTVKKRDEKQCRYCNSKENLHAHHILHKAEFPEFSLLPMNGMTLCSTCHYEVHRIDKK